MWVQLEHDDRYVNMAHVQSFTRTALNTSGSKLLGELVFSTGARICINIKDTNSLIQAVARTIPGRLE